jgi:hypothetical protein
MGVFSIDHDGAAILEVRAGVATAPPASRKPAARISRLTLDNWDAPMRGTTRQ